MFFLGFRHAIGKALDHWYYLLTKTQHGHALRTCEWGAGALARAYPRLHLLRQHVNETRLPTTI